MSQMFECKIDDGYWYDMEANDDQCTYWQIVDEAVFITVKHLTTIENPEEEENVNGIEEGYVQQEYSFI